MRKKSILLTQRKSIDSTENRRLKEISDRKLRGKGRIIARRKKKKRKKKGLLRVRRESIRIVKSASTRKSRKTRAQKKKNIPNGTLKRIPAPSVKSRISERNLPLRKKSVKASSDQSGR